MFKGSLFYCNELSMIILARLAFQRIKKQFHNFPPRTNKWVLIELSNINTEEG